MTVKATPMTLQTIITGMLLRVAEDNTFSIQHECSLELKKKTS